MTWNQILLGMLLLYDLTNYFISVCYSYILSMDHEEDFEEFMDNLIDKSKSAHINSYNGIRHIIFGKKKVLLKDVPSISTNKHNSTSQPKKEKKKFKNINTYEEQKKKKEGE